jgi:cytidylate kinase
MYRVVALEALRRGVSLEDPAELAEIARDVPIRFRGTPSGQRVMIRGEDVTEVVSSLSVSEATSLVSIHPAVRQVLVAEQRRLGEGGGVVIEGRDIGTVVFPDAEVKIFLSASAEERVRRRLEELRIMGIEVEFKDLWEAEQARDRRDAQRVHSPLQAAEGAVIIDTTGRSADEIVEKILTLCQQRLNVL